VNGRTSTTDSVRATRPLFDLGQVVATPAAVALMQECGINGLRMLCRHQAGDFGDLCADDQRSNEAALADGTRIFSSHIIGATVTAQARDERRRIWIITEACDDDGRRRSTCILTPEDY
jgi:hypothetical protein